MDSDIENATIRFLGDLQGLVVRPGDIFVLSCEQAMNSDQIQRLHDVWKAFMTRELGVAPPVLVLANGVKLTKANVQELLDEATR